MWELVSPGGLASSHGHKQSWQEPAGRKDAQTLRRLEPEVGANEASITRHSHVKMTD